MLALSPVPLIYKSRTNAPSVFLDFTVWEEASLQVANAVQVMSVP